MIVAENIVIFAWLTVVALVLGCVVGAAINWYLDREL